MPDHTRRPTELERQLQELLEDPLYARVVRVLTRELGRRWRMKSDDARRYILSAIGEPPVLSEIYRVFVRVRDTGQGANELRLLSRRYVWRLLRKDAARPRHQPLPPPSGEADLEGADRSLSIPGDGERQLESRELRDHVHQALTWFAMLGPTQLRQAEMLRLRILQEVSYKELLAKLAIPTENAARVLLYEAKAAFEKYIEHQYPELHAIFVRWGR